MNEVERKLSQLNGTLDDQYAKAVNDRIRKRYSLSDEISILRKHTKDSETYAEQFEAYNAYAEQCKAEAKAEVYGEEESV